MAKAPPTLKYTIIGPGGAEPRRAMTGDVGYDLFIAEQILVPARSYAEVHHHVAVELPARTWGLLTGRSSALGRFGLHVMQGVIDNGFRGEITTGVFNMRETDLVLEPGQRVSQLIIMPMFVFPVEHTDSLSPTDRGIKGRGSTG